MKFTALKPHTVHPRNPAFAANIDHFDRLCRVVNGMRRMTVGAVGARTTAFKTVRIDELALERHGITMETLDLSDVFNRMEKLKPSDPAMKAKAKVLKAYSDWTGVPARAIDRLVRLGVILDRVVDEFGMDCLAVRCWVEMQQVLGISPCVLLSEMNDRGLATACEVDAGNAVAMHALKLASGRPAACLDWNNNYGDDEGKCILFHCGPVPKSLMTGQGRIEDHAILANAVGKGCAWGCNTGRIAPTLFTFGSLMTEDGQLKFFLGQGEFTRDPIAKDYFGCAGVAEIPGLQDGLRTIGMAGFRHHVSVTPTHVMEPVREAFERYLGYQVIPF
jgi:L-fucose isomerase-like protein